MKTDDELRAEWPGTVKVYRVADPVYEPTNYVVPCGLPIEYDSYGNRIYHNLGKQRINSVMDESTFNYGD